MQDQVRRLTPRLLVIRGISMAGMVVLLGQAVPPLLDQALRSLPEVRTCGWSSCVRRAGDVIEVGLIGPLGARRFVAAVQAKLHQPAATLLVRVDSPGGDLLAATRMVTALRALDVARPVRIEVLMGGRCESMCTVLWAAASERLAAPAARFMFHAPRRAGSAPDERFACLEAEVAAMRAAIGRVDPLLLAEIQGRGAFATVPENVTLTAAEIVALGGNYLRLDPALR